MRIFRIFNPSKDLDPIQAVCTEKIKNYNVRNRLRGVRGVVVEINKTSKSRDAI